MVAKMRLNNIARLIALLATDRRAWKQDCLYFVLCKIYLGLVLAAAAIASAKEDFSPDPQDQGVVWSIVDHGNRAEVLQFLAGQNNGNLQKIRTWQGEYHIKL
jgi:hypothetical protein